MALYCIFYRILFDNSEQCTNWYNRLSKFICPVSRLEDLFAFAFYAWCLDYNSAEKDEFTSFCEQGRCKAKFCRSGEFFCRRQMQYLLLSSVLHPCNSQDFSSDSPLLTAIHFLLIMCSDVKEQPQADKLVCSRYLFARYHDGISRRSQMLIISGR